MMYDLKTLWEKYNDLDVETKFASISDDIWQLGDIEEIREQVSPETFTFHIAVNMIGNWKGDGWHFIFCEEKALLPYIPETLNKLGLEEINNAFEKTRDIFPDFAKDCDDKAYTDVMNFLINPRFNVSDERLKAIPMEEREARSKAYHQGVEELDALSHKVWGYGAAEDGWKNVLDYLKALI